MNRLALLPVRVTIEALELPDGQVVAIQLAHPLQRFAIVRRVGTEPEIVAMFEHEAEAEDAFRRLADELDKLEARPAGVTLQ